MPTQNLTPILYSDRASATLIRGEIIRDDRWLLARLDRIWEQYFPDVSQINPVEIKFGRFARLRFGSIRLDKKTGRSLIILSGIFKDSSISVDIIDHTIAHELCHYAHGFSSPHPRMHQHPHEGGIVPKEMSKRGLDHLNYEFDKWIKEYKKEIARWYRSR